jgi:hypothetical protein
VAAAWAVYGDLLVSGPVLTASSDVIAQHLGTKQVLYRSIQAGHGVPFWRADELSGAPALTHPQSLYTYPLHILFYLLPPERALGPTLWLHFLAAGFAYYLLGAALNLGPAARLVMGLAGMFNYKLIAITYSGWLPVIPCLIFVPLLLASVLYALRRPGPRAVLYLGLSGATCLHTGHLQLVYYAVLYLVLSVGTWTLWAWRTGAGRRAARVWVGLLAGAGLSVGAAAYLLVPLAAEAPLISRGQATFESFLAGHALEPEQWLGLLSPSVGEQKKEFWEDAAYFGLVPLVLAAVGAVLGRKRAVTGFLIFGFLLSLVLTADTGLVRTAFDLVPGFALFRCPARFLFLTSIFGIALAGIGTHEALARLRGTRRPVAVRAAATAALAVAMTLGAHAHAYRLLGVSPWFEDGPPPVGIPPVADTQYARLLARDEDTFRVAPVLRPTVNYGWAAPMNLQPITGFDAYNFRHYQTYVRLLQTGRVPDGAPTVWTDVTAVARPDLLDGLNVRYVLAPGRVDPLPPGWQEVAHLRREPVFVFYKGMTTSDIFVYRNANALPRAYWAARVTGVGSEAELASAVAANNLHAAAVVLDPGDADTRAAPEDAVRIVEQRDGFLAADLRTRDRRFLVVSEVWHPGWRAHLDGEAVPLLRTNIAQMGLWVPDGERRLVLEFRPMYWWPALTISALAGVAIAALAVRVLFWRSAPAGGANGGGSAPGGVGREAAG